MFGYLRFFLATLVMLAHTAGYFQGFHYGVAAVVVFYMLAGHVVCKLILNVFEDGKTLLRRFYMERVLRIFPLYLYVACLVILFFVITDFGVSNFTTLNLTNNLLIVPLNYYMFFDNISNLRPLINPQFFLVPTAWSLGAELQAYLILPFIVRFRSIKIALGVISFFIFLIANFGIVNADHFGYRLLPGVLFVFILGTCIYKNSHDYKKLDTFDKLFPPISYFILICLLLYLGLDDKLHVRFVKETILGILIGMPMVAFCSKNNRKIKFNHLLADLSYGLFLSHFLARWLLDFSAIINIQESRWLYVSTVFIISLFISIIGILLVEQIFKKTRYQLVKEKKIVV